QEKLFVQPKYDGISAKYDGKVLVTRGDGEFGEDVTGKVPLIELEAPGYVGALDRPARGEIVIRDDDFATLYSHIRKKDGNLYKNSRNAVAGIMGLKDIAEMVLQKAKLTLVDYTLVSFEVELAELASRWEDLKSRLAALPYPQDGIVVKFADGAFAASLGRTVHHPRGEIAYKFTNIRRATTLRDVEWSFGKNCLTPVAILDPVEISGTTIRRATLHNLQNILDLGVMIGDRVVVERAGDVIPYIVEAHPGEERRSPLIDSCPNCRTTLVRRGPELVCPNPECTETRLQRLLGAVRNLGIERLGEPTLRKLMTVCGVRHIGDLFEVTAKDVLRLEGFAEKSASSLVSEIQKARRIEDFRLLAALNIPNIGPNIAKLLLAKYSFDDLRRATEDELASVDGIGPERAGAVVAELAKQSAFLDELLGAVTVVAASQSESTAPTVCFTGKMPQKRSFYENLARRAGYRCVDEASSSLSLLVADDPAGNSTKLRNARKFGVKIVSLDEFLAGVSESVAVPDAPEQGELF
ncbi:MAG: helix-hairpin-helix domain-containing protein, partial [Victivallaceae bacterium]|nr:helix-hairpin-helix domain-containing protein [Victivallaceae bacterium]